MRLTELSGQGGCSAKIGQEDLAAVFSRLVTPAAGPLLVSAEGMDDAAVYQLSEDLAVVVTTDFFPPPVDDARDYGAIATANALSDVYAMGGRPLLLLNLVGFDLAALGGATLREILEGGEEVAREAGCAVAGGHSIRTSEPIFGCAVVGAVHPGRVVTNAGARPGDRLLLTKPLGTGVVLNAHKQQRVAEKTLAEAVSVMRRLNRSAAEAMLAGGASAATDVTGFGLLGHAHNLANASGVTVRIEAGTLPAIPDVLDLIRQGLVPGGSRRNLELARSRCRIGAGVDPLLLQLACDAQTSGGLLITAPPQGAHPILSAGVGAVEVGEVLPRRAGQSSVELV
jgi:selenide,water dikinase